MKSKGLLPTLKKKTVCQRPVVSVAAPSPKPTLASGTQYSTTSWLKMDAHIVTTASKFKVRDLTCIR